MEILFFLMLVAIWIVGESYNQIFNKGNMAVAVFVSMILLLLTSLLLYWIHNSSSEIQNSSSNNQSQPTFLLREEDYFTSNSSRLSDGKRYREYQFQGRAAQSVEINFMSNDFDTYLRLLDVSNKVIAENDDLNQQNDDSRLVVTLPYTGTYTVFVSTFSESGLGSYTLTIR